MTRPLVAWWLVDGTVPGDLGPAWGASPSPPVVSGAADRLAVAASTSADQLRAGDRPGDRPGPGSPAVGGLIVTARQVACYHWVESRLFEIVGRWSASEVDESAGALFSVLARQHAWHAELFAERLPVLASVDVELLGPPPTPWIELVDCVDDVVSEQDGSPDSGTVTDVAGVTVGRLVALGRVVLPRLTTTYARHLRRATPADAPLLRTLRLVLAPTRDAWTTVEAMVQDCLIPSDGGLTSSDGGDVTRAQSVANRIQQQLGGLIAPLGSAGR